MSFLSSNATVRFYDWKSFCQIVVYLHLKNTPFGSTDFLAGHTLQGTCGSLLQRRALFLDLQKTLLMKLRAKHNRPHRLLPAAQAIEEDVGHFQGPWHEHGY